MASPSIDYLLNHLEFAATSEEINAAIDKKLALVKAKIAEREERITKLRKEYDISDTDMINLLSQAQNAAVSNRQRQSTYSLSNSVSTQGGGGGGGGGGTDERIIGAGLVDNILTEKSLIETEKEQVKRLSLIRRNLRPLLKYTKDGVSYYEDSFTLSTGDIEFLGM